MVHSFVVLLLSGAAVVAAGILLGRSGERIAAITNLGEMWTGWILLAAATSLPEFVTDVSAVKIHAANLAAGDLFGSSLTNMAILAMLVMFQWPVRENDTPEVLNLFTAWLAIVLTFLGACFTLFHSGVGLFVVRPESLILVLIWLAGTRVLYRQQAMAANNLDGQVSGRNRIRIFQASMIWPVAVFALGSAIIFLIAPAFAEAARNFAAISGLGQSFVGTWLMGFATAMPELVTSLTACRLGAFNLAVANLYGSCAFNMVVFFPMDLASPHTPIFSQLDPVLALSGFLAMGLMLVGRSALAYRRRIAGAPNLSGGFLLACYGAAILVVYLFR